MTPPTALSMGATGITPFAVIDPPKQHGPAIAGPCEVLREDAGGYLPATTFTISRHLVE